MINLAALNMPAGLKDFEPAKISQTLWKPSKGRFEQRLQFRRGTNPQVRSSCKYGRSFENAFEA
jgi:hypothetical protein